MTLSGSVRGSWPSLAARAVGIVLLYGMNGIRATKIEWENGIEWPTWTSSAKRLRRENSGGWRGGPGGAGGGGSAGRREDRRRRVPDE